MMEHLLDIRTASCIQYASRVLDERVGIKLPLPNLSMDGTNEREAYKKQLEDANVNLVRLQEPENNSLILFSNPAGYHMGVWVDGRVYHGGTGGKSVASRLSELENVYDVRAIYRLERGKPGEVDENLHKAEFLDPFSIFLVAILAIGAAQWIKNYLDPDRNLPEREPSDTFNLVGGQNRTRPDEALPLTFGRIRHYPDFSIPPYNRYAGGGPDNTANQLWRAGVNFGVGRLSLDNLRLGNTDFLDFLSFSSTNSFDVIGGPNERPSYWDQNVGGSRARTQEFISDQSFSFIPARTTISVGGRIIGEFNPDGGSFSSSDFLAGGTGGTVATDLSIGIQDRELIGQVRDFLSGGEVTTSDIIDATGFLEAVLGFDSLTAEEIVRDIVEGGEGGDSGVGSGGGGGRDGTSPGRDTGDSGPGSGGGGGDR